MELKPPAFNHTLKFHSHLLQKILLFLRLILKTGPVLRGFAGLDPAVQVFR